MDAQSAFHLSFDFGTSKPVVVEPSAAQVSSDAGLLAFRQLDEHLGLSEQLAECLSDRRHSGYIRSHVSGNGPHACLRHPGRLRRPE
jgi:hypothetical protein